MLLGLHKKIKQGTSKKIVHVYSLSRAILIIQTWGRLKNVTS